MVQSSKPLTEIWRSSEYPALFRRGKGFKLWVRIDQTTENLRLIRLRDTYPKWIPKQICYEVPNAWFNLLVKLLVGKFGGLYVIQPYREKEICSPSCKAAVGHECECQCFGQYHGVGYAGNDWFEVADACEVRWGEKQWGCRFMQKPGIPLISFKK